MGVSQRLKDFRRRNVDGECTDFVKASSAHSTSTEFGRQKAEVFVLRLAMHVLWSSGQGQSNQCSSKTLAIVYQLMSMCSNQRGTVRIEFVHVDSCCGSGARTK